MTCRCSRVGGLTLVEMLILLLIIVSVVSLLLPNILSRLDDVRIEAAREDIADLSRALERYRLDNIFYPSTEQGLQALIEKPDIKPLPRNWNEGGYLDMKRIPLDPWGNPYQYESGPGPGSYTLYSLGADGEAGGAGNNADIFASDS